MGVRERIREYIQVNTLYDQGRPEGYDILRKYCHYVDNLNHIQHTTSSYFRSNKETPERQN
jgi:hypothetical protein